MFRKATSLQQLRVSRWALQHASCLRRPSTDAIVSIRTFGSATHFPFPTVLPTQQQHRWYSAAPSSDPEEQPPAFNEIPELDANLKQVLSHKGLTTMSEIQHRTWGPILDGEDVLGRARTGTGKTMAFLLPAVQRLLNSQLNHQKINMVVVSPTRELAAQIYDQSHLLTSAERGKLSSQVVFGGVPKTGDYRAFQRRVPNILVATPGRLIDHMENSTINREPFINLMDEVSIVVLDETDRLLDMGFRDDIKRILRAVPNQKRQTLLFSATVPNELKSILRENLSPNFHTVDCIQDEDPASHTNEKVDQHSLMLSDQETVHGTVEFILGIMEESKDNKLIVFFPTTHMVSLFSKLFNDYLQHRVLEIHAKKSQQQRSRVSEKFRQMTSGALFTTDVSARGVDYPGVTHVVQFGMADSRETYIHRLGRTGRAGAKGKGIVILSPMQQNFLQTLQGLDIQPLPEPTPGAADGRALAPAIQRIDHDIELKEAVDNAYKSLLGYYSTTMKNLPGQRYGSNGMIVDLVNGIAQQMGLTEMPRVSFKTAQQVGMARESGLNIGSDGGGRSDGFASRSGYDRYGGGGDRGGSRYGGGGYSQGGGGRRRNDDGYGRGSSESYSRRGRFGGDRDSRGSRREGGNRFHY